MSQCEDCSSSSVYVSEAMSHVCQQCGFVFNVNQLELHFNEEAASAADSGRSVYHGPQTLRTWDGRRAVMGQALESRRRNNKKTAHDGITNLLARFSSPGLAPRATNIFDLAMDTQKFRWGPTSTSLVGAATAAALREAGREECFRQISSALSIPLISLVRRFVEMTTLLKLELPATNDPSIYLITLVRSLPTLTRDDSQLPASLKKFISPLSLESVLVLATSIAGLTNRVSLTHNRFLPAAACALLIVALEGEQGKEIPSIGVLAEELGRLVGTSKSTVMERYREIGRLIEDWKRALPWANTDSSKAKVKVPRKDNAQWIKDVVAYQAECGKTEQGSVPADGQGSLQISFDETEDLPEDFFVQDWISEVPSADAEGDGDTDPRTRKRRCLETDAQLDSIDVRPALYVRKAAGRNALYKRTLLTAASSLLTPDGLGSTVEGHKSVQSLRTYLLTSGDFPRDSPPTRLAELASYKGECAIEDCELFDEGELERMIRTPGEVEEIRVKLEQYWSSADIKEEEAPVDTVLQDLARLSDDGGMDAEWQKKLIPLLHVGSEVVSEWRPASPGHEFEDNFECFEDVGW